MKDFFDTWKFKILIAVAVFLVGVLAYAGANGRLTAAPQELLSVAAAPFQRVASAISGGISAVWDKYTSIDAVAAENEALRAENAELREQMVEYDRLKAENQAYKALANIQQRTPELVYVSAFVIGRDPLDAFWGFTLDKGMLDGVSVGDPIVSDAGYLLGMVTEAELTSCKVMTILHPSFNAAGVVSRTRDNRHPDRQCRICGRGTVHFYQSAPRHRSTPGGSDDHHRSGRCISAGCTGGDSAGAGAGGQRQVGDGGDPSRRRCPHGQARFYHHRRMKGITPWSHAVAAAAVSCSNGAAMGWAADLHRAADLSRLIPAGAGKTIVSAAVVPGSRQF